MFGFVLPSQKYINHKPLPTAPKGFVEGFGKKQFLRSFWSCNTLDEIGSAFLKRSKTVLGNSYLLESEINSYLNNTEEVDRVNDLDVAPAETKLFRATNSSTKRRNFHNKFCWLQL